MPNQASLVHRAPPGAEEAEVSSFLRRNALALILAAVGGVLLFRSTLSGLFACWVEDPDFSHGFLIAPICAAVLFRNRKVLGALPARRSWLGILILFVSLLVFFAGRLTITDVLERLGLFGSLIGGIWFLVGPGMFLVKPFPFFFFLFSIPPPSILLGPLRQVLRRIATLLSSDILLSLGIVALPEGNVLSLGEHKLEVADACSGIRSLVVMLATAVLFAYLFRAGFWKGLLLTPTAVPVTILNNILRIVVVAVALDSFRMDLTEGMAHEFLSIATFGLSVCFLYLSWRFYIWFFRFRTERPAP